MQNCEKNCGKGYYKRPFIWVFTMTLFMLCQTAAAQEVVQSEPASAQAYASLPVTTYRLSPSGEKVAYFIPYKGRRVLITQKRDGTEQKHVPPWDDDIELVSFFWKTDTYVIFAIHMTMDRAQFRNKTTETRTFSYNLDTNKIVWLGKPKKTAFNRGGIEQLSQFETVVHDLPNDPKHLLLELDFDTDGFPMVYRTNIESGSRKRTQTEREGINDWYADESSTIRFGQGYRPNSAKRQFIYKTNNDEWLDVSDLFADNHIFEGLGPEINQVYVTKLNQYGTKSLLLIDVTTQKIVQTLFENNTLDARSVVYHPSSQKVIGVSYTDDFYRESYVDKDFKIVQRSLAKAFPNEDVTITDKAQNANLYLVMTTSDTNPGSYYLFNRDTKEVTYFADARSDINPMSSAKTKRVDITVSDGSSIPAYLTLPRQATNELLPTIVLPHGGPHARDTAHWRYDAQFFASRGYAVLKPNFRGSTGYGTDFLEKGEKQWGGLMQQDLTDATHWLVDNKISDPARICIVGASYGGYAAMMGLAQQPELYACGISINGVLNLPALISTDKNVIGGKDWVKKMGLEGAGYKEVSPTHQADKITAPTLLIASTNDARISYKQTKIFYNKLKKLKQETTYLELDTGTHYMLNSESRLGYLEAAEVFLAKHLKPNSY